MILPYNWIITALRGNPKAGRQEAGNQATRQAEAPTPGQPASQLVGWLFGGFGWGPWRVEWGFFRLGRRPGGGALGGSNGVLAASADALAGSAGAVGGAGGGARYCTITEILRLEGWSGSSG